MRFRITVRGDACELRGYLDDTSEGHMDLPALAEAVKPFGIVVASPAADDYDPFSTFSTEVQKLADEAEAGYDVDKIGPNRIKETPLRGQPGLQQEGGSLGGF